MGGGGSLPYPLILNGTERKNPNFSSRIRLFEIKVKAVILSQL